MTLIDFISDTDGFLDKRFLNTLKTGMKSGMLVILEI
jgi:hypothetical protein